MKKEKAVKTFKEIRDLPYHISINGELGQDCGDKSSLLAEKLTRLGFEAKTVIGLFRWSDTNLPKEIIAKPHADNCSHMFVSLKNSLGTEIFIDPTWNIELKKAGFPVAEWDGETSTLMAVPCYRVLTVKESEEYLKGLDSKKDLEESGKLYEAINDYCDSFLGKEW